LSSFFLFMRDGGAFSAKCGKPDEFFFPYPFLSPSRPKSKMECETIECPLSPFFFFFFSDLGARWHRNRSSIFLSFPFPPRLLASARGELLYNEEKNAVPLVPLFLFFSPPEKFTLGRGLLPFLLLSLRVLDSSSLRDFFLKGHRRVPTSPSFFSSLYRIPTHIRRILFFFPFSFFAAGHDLSFLSPLSFSPFLDRFDVRRRISYCSSFFLYEDRTQGHDR